MFHFMTAFAIPSPSLPAVGLGMLIHLFTQQTVPSSMLYCGAYKGEQPSWKTFHYSKYFEVVIQKLPVKLTLFYYYLLIIIITASQLYW